MVLCATDGDSETQNFISAFGLPILRKVSPILSIYPPPTSKLHLYPHLFALYLSTYIVYG